MDKWQYMRCYYFTRDEKGKGAFSAPEAHEYLVIEKDPTRMYKDSNIPKILDHLGGTGWELISATPIVGQKPKYAGAGGVAVALTAGPIAQTSVTTTQEVILWFKRKTGSTSEDKLPGAL